MLPPPSSQPPPKTFSVRAMASSLPRPACPELTVADPRTSALETVLRSALCFIEHDIASMTPLSEEEFARELARIRSEVAVVSAQRPGHPRVIFNLAHARRLLDAGA